MTVRISRNHWPCNWHIATNLTPTAINRRDRATLGVWYVDACIGPFWFWLSGNSRRHRVKTKPIDPKTLRPITAWIDESAREVADHLRAFAERYPDRFEFTNGKLTLKGKP